MKQPRIVTAVLFAPASLFVLFFLAAPLFSGGSLIVYFGLIASMIAFVGMVFVGIPVILVFTRYGMTQWWQVTLAGAAVPFLLTLPNARGAALIFGFCGAFVAFVAWFIAFFRLRDAEEQTAGAG